MRSVRAPKVGERIRFKLKDGTWIWTEPKRYLAGSDEMFEVIGGLVLHVDDYGTKWRFGEDDPEVCTERPAVKGDDDE